ncbi:MAG: hypothetical protein WC661_02045 [Opitutaceae bacterium]
MKNQRDRDSISGKQPAPAITGELEDWFETGLEGVVWALIDDANNGYDSLHVIEEGDDLTVLDKAGTVLWQGTIECDRKTGATPRPTNPHFIQQQALGCWIHWIQKGFEPDHWAEFFIRRPDDRLRGVLVKKSTQVATNVSRGEITDLNAKTESLKCSAGETLREDYMAPLGLSARQIAEAIPPDATHPARNWAAEIESFAIGDEEAFVNLDLSLALDRYFGLPDGYFWRLQAVCSVRDRIPQLKPWLDRVKPRQCENAQTGSGKPTGSASADPLNDSIP